jgi:hypothetical protein
MCEDVLQCVRKLESIHVSETKLNMGIHDKLGESQNFAAQVEGIPETRLFPLLGRERLHRLQVHVVIQVEIVQVLKHMSER